MVFPDKVCFFLFVPMVWCFLKLGQDKPNCFKKKGCKRGVREILFEQKAFGYGYFLPSRYKVAIIESREDFRFRMVFKKRSKKSVLGIFLSFLELETSNNRVV